MFELSWKIAGPAGYGIMTTGLAFSKALSRGGWHVFNYPEYPSLIRGGHNTYQVRAGMIPVLGPTRGTDILVALNQESVPLHLSELSPESVVIHDYDFPAKAKCKLLPLPFKELAEEDVMRNTVALGATVAVLDYDLDLTEKVLMETFASKSEDVVKSNVNALRRGYAHAKDSGVQYKESFEVIDSEKRMVLTGNDAICLGALKAGMKMYCAYPMTPASSILHYFAAHERDMSIVVKHTEDELAAMNMTLGGNFAGVRTMVGTSGGGFALMTEALGNAGISEVPLVAVEAQRGGPSTGIPTWTSQADLKFVVNASQGEFPRIVLAPGDVRDAFYLTFDAFNLSERFQVPVILLSDKHLSESAQTSEFFATDTLAINRGEIIEGDIETGTNRYSFTENGVSPRWFPGQKGGMHKGTSYEHDESGVTTEKAEACSDMYEKRMRKRYAILEAMSGPTFFGPLDAQTTIIGWGSTKGAILEALHHLHKDGKSVNFAQFTHIFPIDESVQDVLTADKLVGVECNITAQFAGILSEFAKVDVDMALLKYDGRPFFPRELYSRLKEVV